MRACASGLVRPPDRHAGGAVGELLRCLGVAHDRRKVALELEPAEHDPLGGVEFLLRHLLPAGVGPRDHELCLLRVLATADTNIASFAVPEVEEDTHVLWEVLVRLSE